MSNAGQWLQRADDALACCQDALQKALLDKAALLHSDALRERLAQGRDEPFIAGLLAMKTAQEVADYVAQTMGGEAVPRGEATPRPDPIALLTRYLKKLRVRKLSLADFSPSKRMVEISDVDQIVFEFRTFLSEALVADKGELPIVELE